VADFSKCPSFLRELEDELDSFSFFKLRDNACALREIADNLVKGC
jgi:hypothetical protein